MLGCSAVWTVRCSGTVGRSDARRSDAISQCWGDRMLKVTWVVGIALSAVSWGMLGVSDERTTETIRFSNIIRIIFQILAKSGSARDPLS